jgi:hypothetical protein
MDILFLLTPGFEDSARDGDGKRYYCPDCAFLEGVLACCPDLRNRLDIRYVDYPRPRRPIVDLVGEAHQGCPNLVLDPGNHQFVDAGRFAMRVPGSQLSIGETRRSRGGRRPGLTPTTVGRILHDELS